MGLIVGLALGIPALLAYAIGGMGLVCVWVIAVLAIAAFALGLVFLQYFYIRLGLYDIACRAGDKRLAKRKVSRRG
jgi:ABC-type dipeptide/oligopeptide/nickel transport system permease component